MKLFSWVFSKRQPTLKKSRFARDRWRDNEPGEFLKNASTDLHLLVAFFLAPVVAATSFLAEDVFLMGASVLLAFGYLSQFAFRVYKKEASILEQCFTILGLAGAIALVVHFVPLAFSVELTAISVLTCCSMCATAINSFFCVKNIIVPPLKRMGEIFFSYFGLDLRGDYFHTKPFDPARDRFPIAHLLNLAEGVPYGNEHDAELKPYNVMLKKLDAYNNKYSEAIFGGLFRQEDIKNIEIGIKALTRKGDSKDALGFINDKIKSKHFKVTEIKEAINAFETACKNHDLALYNHHGNLCFDHYIRLSSFDDMKPSWAKLLPILNEELTRQRQKVSGLDECLPLPHPSSQ